MIQRIQTVYLAIAILFNILFFFNPLFYHVRTDPGDWLLPLVAASCAFAAVLAGWAILLYKNRQRQIQVISYAILFQVVSFGAASGIFFSMGRLYRDSIWELSGVMLLLLALMFEFMAIRGIKNDIKLIKSMDRIR